MTLSLQTVFEICTKNKSVDYIAMKAAREFHKDNIVSHKKKLEQLKAESKIIEHKEMVNLPASNEEDISETFNKIVLPKKRKIDYLYKNKVKKQRVFKDEHYIPYSAPDRHTEEG